ncbi:MAG: MFS transporter, partial [Dehalococcoidia bacterium]|nr:MFS transporter [Dehalococcoidia bacterium]
LPFTQFLISNLGWRGAWSALALIFFFIAAPISLIFLRRQPEDIGLVVDGDKVSPDHADTGKENPLVEIQWTVKEALHTGALWKLMFVFAVTGMARGGASVHRIQYWIERGFDAHIVSYAFSADAAGAATMALISGWLADRFPIRYIAGISFVGFTVAIFLMICGFDEVFLFASTITFGLSVGAGMVVHSYIFASYFGREFLGAIRGIVMPVNLISAGLGAPIVGYMHDGMGTYTSAWWLLISLYAIGALVVVTVTPPKHPVLGNSPVL